MHEKCESNSDIIKRNLHAGALLFELFQLDYKDIDKVINHDWEIIFNRLSGDK